MKQPEIIVVVGMPRIRKVRTVYMPYTCSIGKDDVPGAGWSATDAYDDWIKKNVIEPREAFRRRVETEAARWIENHLQLLGR